MADESQERTEEATPHKRKKARERGQVAQSRDLSSALVLLAAAGGLVWRNDAHAGALRDAFTLAVTTATRRDLDTKLVLDTAGTIASSVATALLPFLGLLAVTSGLASFVQVGPLLTLEPIKPKLERLDPIQGLKRMFASLKAWVNLARSVVKLIVVAAVAWATFSSHIEDLLALLDVGVGQAMVAVAGLSVTLILRVVMAFLVLSVVDVLYQRWQLGKDLRMSKQELKREFREQDGSPEQKAARKRAHQEVLDRGDLERVRKEAGVVVVNPTHYACALGYSSDDEAPRLVAKGQDHMARRIRAVAEEAGIPIRHDVSLARALYELEVDTMIPPALYDATAITLDWVREVLKQRGESPRWIDPADDESDAGDATRSGLVR